MSSLRKRWKYHTPLLDYVEDVERYCLGGYHPINLGDILNGKYKIIHKLGYGGFSTLWLALVLNENRYAAIKVLTADCSNQESNQELKILKHLQACGTSHSSIIRLQETFDIYGPNGVHSCSVLDVIGPSIKVIQMGKQLSVPTIRKAAPQIVLGLTYLHSLGICHGDLTVSNVLFELKRIDNWSEAEVYSHLGVPQIERLRLINGSNAQKHARAPANVVQSIRYLDLDESHLSGNIRVIDFGQSFFTKNPPSEFLGTPVSFFAPEMLFGFSASEKSDVWALGCLIFELRVSKVLFPTIFGRLDEALGMAIATLGPLPKSWRYSYFDTAIDLVPNLGEEHYWFDEHAHRDRLLLLQLQTIRPQLHSEECNAFCDLLCGALAYKPDNRFSAMQVASHQWFTQ